MTDTMLCVIRLYIPLVQVVGIAVRIFGFAQYLTSRVTLKFYNYCKIASFNFAGAELCPCRILLKFVNVV